MFTKYLFSDNFLALLNAPVISFSYTELQTEPSIIHTHPHCEIIIPLNKNGYVLHPNKQTPFNPNEIYVINPHIPHTEFNIKPNPTDTQTAKYFVVKINDIIYENNGNPIEFVAIANSPLLAELKDYLFKAYNQYTNKNEELTILNLASFYYLFVELLKETNLYKNVTLEAVNPIQTDILLEFDYYISKNYHLDIRIKDFLSQYNISYNSLVKKCKKALGCTPSIYILRKRIDMSKHLLNTTDYSIWQVAQMCGFISSAYYTLQFKKFEHITPSEYRRQKHPTSTIQ